MVVVDSKDNLQDPNVRTEAISGTNLFGFKDQIDQLEENKTPATAITTPQKKRHTAETNVPAAATTTG